MPFLVLTLLTLGGFSLAHIALGLYALIRRRPFIIHTRWFLAMGVAVTLPIIFWPLSLLGENRHGTGGFLLWFPSLMFIVLLCQLAMVMRGYWILGATQRSLREALVAALTSLNLEFEETLSSIRLPSVPAELHVALYGMGTGQLRIRDGGRPGLLADVAGGMNAYFNSTRVETKMIFAVFDVIIGVLAAAMMLMMTPMMLHSF